MSLWVPVGGFSLPETKGRNKLEVYLVLWIFELFESTGCSVSDSTWRFRSQHEFILSLIVLLSVCKSSDFSVDQVFNPHHPVFMSVKSSFQLLIEALWCLHWPHLCVCKFHSYFTLLLILCVCLFLNGTKIKIAFMFPTQRINLRVFKPDMMKLYILLISRSYNNVVLLLWKPEFKNKYELSTTLQNKTSSCFCFISIFWWCSGSLRHQKHLVKVSEINNRVQSHTQSCECLRVFSGVTLLCVVQFVLWTWWVLTCIRTRFTMHRLDLLLSMIFYISSDVFGNVGRVLNRVLTHWRVVSVEDQNF